MSLDYSQRVAVRDYNLVLPSRLEEWIKIDTTDAEKIVHPWYTRGINNYIKLLQLSGLLLDGKLEMIKAMLHPGEALSSSVASSDYTWNASVF